MNDFTEMDPGIAWDDLIDRARATWELHARDLDVEEGDTEELVNRIQDLTGESTDEIRTRLMAEDDSLLGTDADDFESL